MRYNLDSFLLDVFLFIAKVIGFFTTSTVGQCLIIALITWVGLVLGDKYDEWRDRKKNPIEEDL